jgi:hypothetical protein
MTQQIEKLLNDVGFRLATLREARNRFSDQLAPEFRIFDYLRTDEMGLSRCIASLLDPKGKHGQGGIFLEAFLKLLGNAADWAIDAEDCEVSIEKQANEQRRIDIYLELKNGIIGIENKPWANDQDKQLADYAAYLEKMACNKNWLLVFLSKRDPSEGSLDFITRKKLEDGGRFVQCDYDVIISWLDICACKSRALVVRVFIEELAKFIRTNVNREVEMSDEREISSAVLKSSETLSSAFHIAKTMGSIKKSLLSKFHDDLVIGLEEKDLKLADWRLESWQSCTGFNVRFGNSEQKLYLRFEFNRTGLDDFFWGIKDINADSARGSDNWNSDAWRYLNQLMVSEFYSEKSSKWWPWYSELPNREFNAELKNWSISEKPWIMINNGELTSKIVELAVKVRDVFHHDNRLCLLNEEVINAVQLD